MRDLDARVEPLLSHLPQAPRLPKDAENTIRQAIVESPYLHALLGNAAGDKQIGAIKVSYGEHNGGHFETGQNVQSGTLYISAANFTQWSGSARLGLITEVLGHEGMHGVLTSYRQDALAEFNLAYGKAMTQAYRNFDERVDVTEPVRKCRDGMPQWQTGISARSSATRSGRSVLAYGHPLSTMFSWMRLLNLHSLATAIGSRQPRPIRCIRRLGRLVD